MLECIYGPQEGPSEPVASVRSQRYCFAQTKTILVDFAELLIWLCLNNCHLPFEILKPA